MAESRKPIYYNPVTGEFQQFDPANDALKVIIGTDKTAGETFQPETLLYVKDSDGKVYKADATDDAKRNVLFWALESAPAIDAVVQVALPANEVPATVDSGKKYFLDPATPGDMTTTPPNAANQWVVEVGTASEDDYFVFNPRTRIKL